MHRIVTALCATCCAASASAGPVFVLNDRGGVAPDTAARAGFEMAAQRFADLFGNNVTINIDVSFTSLGSGVLGSTNSSSSTHLYADVRNSLLLGASSSADRSATPYLASRLSFLSNEAGNCTTGVGCAGLDLYSRTLDDDDTFDNTRLRVTLGNARALGLIDPNYFGRDAGIAFNSRMRWDFDPTDGISRGAYDFVGIATHEIAHALGVTSGVDFADGMMAYAYRGVDNIGWGTTLDLFRYTGLDRDWTVAGTPCISADGGRSCIGQVSTGVKFGNGRQASHWRSSTTGVLAPTATSGRLLTLTEADITLLDLIGWSRLLPSEEGGTLTWTSGDPLRSDEMSDWEDTIVTTPTAPTLAMFGLGAIALTGRLRRHN